MLSLTTGLLLGLLLGARHALEPDHLTAVSVLIARGGRGRAGAGSGAGAGVVIGALWGVGHSLALLVVGCALAAMETRLPVRLGQGFEILVGAMLIALGTRTVAQGRPRPAGAATTDPPDDARPGPGLRRPFLIGLVHGLAGSGALTALALANFSTVGTRLLYILLFGLGSAAGMAALTSLAGWPLARLRRHRGLWGWLSLSMATGALSILLGSVWGWAALRALLRA